MGVGPSLEVSESNRLKRLRRIGKGACSSVFLGLLDSDRPVAVKRLRFREDGDYRREAEVLSRLEHDNIIEYFGLFENAKGTYDLVFELACDITLAGALHRGDLGTSWKRSTIHQISAGVAYLHSQNVIHLDLKPPNILFKDRDLQRVLISDFGMATRASSSRHAGARNFRAPDSPFTKKSDVFSLASIACCIFAERNPESAVETANIVSDVLRNYDFGYNRAWRLVLGKGVDARAHKRPSAEQFCDTFDESLISKFKPVFFVLLAFLFYRQWRRNEKEVEQVGTILIPR